MSTLGTAYVQIVPSAQGISGKIQSVLDPEAKAAGTSAGKQISGTIGKGLTTVGGKISSYITKPAAGAAAALGGLTLAKGWSRMVEIDNARAKLKALGQDADAVKDSANEAVTGTAYSLNKAMSTGASAVAAGIKPGKELTRYLSNIADAAAVAGIDMDEMGSIFNKVATNGKMSAEEMNQLADRGIPVMQLLAKTTGKSMDEVRDAISKGEIGIGDLQKAIETGMGGAAKSIGSSTISGALSNVMASIGRIGANLWGSSDDVNSIAGKILPLLNSVMKALAPVEARAKSLGVTIASVVGPAIDRITNMLNGGAEGGNKALAMADMAKAKLIAIATGVTAALGPIMVGVGKLIPLITGFGGKLTDIATKLGTTRGTLLRFGGVFGLIAAAFITAYTQSEPFRQAIQQIGSLLGQTFMSILRALGPVLQTAGQLFAQIATTLGNILGPVLMALMPLLQRVLGVVASVVNVAMRALNTIMRAFTRLGSLPGTVKTIFESVKARISSAISGARARVSSAVNTIKSFMSFGGIVGKVQSVFNKVRDKIKQPIEKAREIVKNAINKIKNMFPFSVGKIFSGKITLPKISVKKDKGGGASTSSTTRTKNFARAMDQPYMFETGTYFKAGEAGDEMLYGRTSLMRDITEAIRAGGGNGGGTLQLVINLDGKTIGQATVDYLNGQTLMFGTSPALV